MIQNNSGSHIICNKTCSATISCDSCPENPNKRDTRTFIDVSTYPINEVSGVSEETRKRPVKNLPKFEKQKLKQGWKATQDKHSRKR